MSHTAVVKIVIVFLQISMVLSASDYIVQVTPTCAAKAGTGTTTVTVVTDAPDTAPLAFCKDDWDFYFTLQLDGTYTLDVHFTGDSSNVCVFKKLKNVETYFIDAYVPETAGIFTFNTPPHKVICNYEDTGTGDSDPSQVGDSLNPINEVQKHMAVISKSTVSLCVANVFGNCISGRIRLGKSIMLKAELQGNHADEPSFQALSCVAKGGKSQYPILVGGCGDGLVLRKTQGFTTKGKIAKSPFFKSFRVPGSRSLDFDCTFVVCKQNCDGSSCDAQTRKKRDTSHQKYLTFNKTLKIHHEQQSPIQQPIQIPIEVKLETNKVEPKKQKSSEVREKVPQMKKSSEVRVETTSYPGFHYGLRLEFIFFVMFALFIVIGIVIILVQILLRLRNVVPVLDTITRVKANDYPEKESRLS